MGRLWQGCGRAVPPGSGLGFDGFRGLRVLGVKGFRIEAFSLKGLGF